MNNMRKIRTLLLALFAILLTGALVACETEQGEQGEMGLIGRTGQPGRAGPRGDTGSAGPLGAQGELGKQGETGAQGEIGLQGETGLRGEVGAAGKTFTEDELMAIINELLADLTLAGGIVEGDPVLGGLLFDDWTVVTGVLPEGEHGLWGIQSTNTATGVATWLCNECHGWDYKGAGGEYATGDHYTGFLGLVESSRLLTQVQTLEFMHGGVDARHDFTNWLTDDQMLDLSAFLKLEIINLATYVDYETLQPRIETNAARGELLYNRTCGSCHGDDGTNLLMGEPGAEITLSEYSKTKPFAMIHKTRFGQPGVPGMPAVENRGWSIDDVLAVLEYMQSIEP